MARLLFLSILIAGVIYGVLWPTPHVAVVRIQKSCCRAAAAPGCDKCGHGKDDCCHTSFSIALWLLTPPPTEVLLKAALPLPSTGWSELYASRTELPPVPPPKAA